MLTGIMALVRLVMAPSSWAESKLRYELLDGKVRGLDLSEDEPLPEKLSKGQVSYHDLKPGQS